MEANGVVPFDQAEDLESQYKEAVQSQDVDDDAGTTTFDVGNDSPPHLPADSSKEISDFEAGEDRVGDGIGERESEKTKDVEPEPEVIFWDALNESDVDDLVSSNAHAPSLAGEDTNEIVSRENVKSDGLQEEPGTSIAGYEPKTSVAEAEEKEALKLQPEAIPPVENVVVDSANESKVQHTGANGEKSGGPKETSGKVEGSGNLGAAEQADFEQAGTVDDAKEVDVNKGAVAEEHKGSIPGRDSAGIDTEVPSGSGNYEQTNEVDEQPPVEAVVDNEEVEAKPREFGLDGKADGTDENPGKGSAGAEKSVASENGALESEAQGAVDAPQGLKVGRETTATQVPDPKDNETVEPHSLGGLSKGEEGEQESPIVEAAGDPSAKGEDSVLENASLVPVVEDSKTGESMESPALEKTADVSSKEEESVDESASRVPGVKDSKKEERMDGSSKEEESADENSPLVHAVEDSKKEESLESPIFEKTADISSQEAVEDSKKEESTESPILEKTADVSSKEEEPVDENASSVPAAEDSEKKESMDVLSKEEAVDENASLARAVEDSKKEESMKSPISQKTADVSSKEEESDDEKPLTAGAATVESSKASTSPGNDAASSLGGAGPSLPARPAGLGRSVPSLEHAPRAVQRSSAVPASGRQASSVDEENGSSTDVSEGSEDAREKLQMIRVKFLRLANRLGQSAHNVVVAQVLYRLGLAEQLRGGRGTGRSGAFSFERASALAEEQEAAGTDDLEFGCTIMVLGKSGVGKSATINSLFDEVKSGTNAYSPATNKVQEIIGTVHGIKLRVIDTPGLLTSFADQRRNERVMSSVKRFIKKSPPDIVLYFDRLDMQSRDYGDLPLLRTITDTFGSAVWFNAIVVLTHASSAPPDGANGVPVSYEMFVAQRSHVVQQTIRQAAGDMRLMNPVSLVENHAACRRNRAGERVLPNGQVWKPQLLLLCFASKILAEANSLLKLQDNSPTKPFGVRSRVPPLPFLLSSLLQSRAQLKLPDEQIGSDDESEDESDEGADSEGEEEYDDLPPFRRLTKEELKLLDKEQRKIYAEELEYREKLFMKKQLKDERARKKEMKRRMAALPKEAAQFAEEMLEEENAAASVPVAMPDMALPPSFDSDNPTYRYRYLDNANQWLVRPVLETHGWDHDSGYDGLNVEKMFVISKKVPVSVSGQLTKDKKEANLQMECAATFKNGEGKFTQAGLDIQTIGKDLAYTVRSETRFDNFKRNKTTCGLAVTLLGETVAAGMKIEDRLLIGKRVKLVFNGGALTGRGDVAYGGSLEATIRDKDYPIGQFLSTFGLSVMDWHGDLAIGGNLQVQCKLGKTMTIVRGNLNNRKAGQISIRVSNSEQLQIALIGLIPLLRTFINNRILSSN